MEENGVFYQYCDLKEEGICWKIGDCESEENWIAYRLKEDDESVVIDESRAEGEKVTEE